jgi:PAS domain S-box-containing protein
MNPAAEKMLKRHKDKVLHSVFFDMIHPKDRQRISNLYELSNSVFQYQCRLIDKQKSVKWIHVIALRFLLPSGDIFFNFINDITNHIINTEKQQRLFDTIPDAIAEFDVVNKKILSINSAMATHFNQTPNDMMGKDFLPFLQIDVYQRIFHLAKTAREENRIITDLVRRDKHDFKELYIPLSYPTKKTTILFIIKDITTFTKAKNELQKSNQRFREIFNASIDAYFIINPDDLVIVDANIEAIKRFGLNQNDIGIITANDIVGTSFFSTENTSKQRFVEQILSGKIERQDIPLKIKKKGYCWHEIFMKSIEIDEEIQLLMIARNISKRKMIEDQIINYSEGLKDNVERKTRKLNEMITERELLLEEVHHRVKNNLQIITSLIDLQCDAIDDEQEYPFFETLKNRIYIMSLLHEQLYKSKDFKYVRLTEYLQGIVENLQRSFSDQSKKISINICETKESIDFKKAISCGLIINELVSNALKHAFTNQDNGHIAIDIFNMFTEHNC